MRSLAALILKGRWQAVLVACVSAILALVVTPIGLVSSASIGLVALRRGMRDALEVMALALLGLALLGWFLLGSPWALPVLGLALWLPVSVLGWVLRATRSLRLTVELAVLASFALIGLQHLLLGDVTAYWQSQLTIYMQQAVAPELMTDADKDEMAKALAPWMAGGLGVAWFMQLVLGLFLARGAQALLFNPGGFAQEFRNLWLGRWLLVLLPVLMLGDLVLAEPGLLSQCALVGMAAFFIQGVALAHGLVDRTNNKPWWLIGFYFVLVAGMPASFTAVAAAGYLDGWMNIRTRVRSRKPDNGGE